MPPQSSGVTYVYGTSETPAVANDAGRGPQREQVGEIPRTSSFKPRPSRMSAPQMTSDRGGADRSAP
ncbi:hypothetical protein [Streptomyces nigra]|uniref:hypothetical protein n=1 Tax=Streptomyces nigra TaxID=1827580 RepID=UPI0035E340D1